MKKSLWCIAFIMMCASVVAPLARCYEADGDLTKGYSNGRWVEKSGDYAKLYILGAIDGLTMANPGDLKKLYPGMTKGDITQAVLLYYRNNPRELSRPVVDVIMTGCR